jgi:uncharacterized protein YprB with RNaseH-like and TPR domain
VDAGDFLVLDVETAGGNWSTFPAGFNLLLTGTRAAQTYGAYTAVPASLVELARFLSLWDGPVVTFNGAKFDLPVLDRWFTEVLAERLDVRQHYDLAREIERQSGIRISLDRVSRYTFGEEKMAWDHRRNARSWAEEPHRMIDYNRIDLDLTHELFMRVLRAEPLFLGEATVMLDPPGPSTFSP